MDGGTVAQWTATGVIGATLLYSLWRNGRASSNAMASLENEVKNVKEKLEDDDTGLSAIKKSVDEQKLYCVRTTTQFDGRIKALEERRGDAK